MSFNYPRYKSYVGKTASGSGRRDLVHSQLDAGTLYTFSSFTFTSSVNGRNGPTLSQLLATYNTTTFPWLTNTAYFNMVVNGIQLWTVPQTGTYRILAIGGRGGTVSATFPGGRGASIQGDFALEKGTIVAILVGQSGTQSALSTSNKGGGGGSFVWLHNYQNVPALESLLIAAGGGGGAQASASGVNASLTTSGTVRSDGGGTPGTNGQGTTNGAGWLSVATLGTGGGSVAALRPIIGDDGTPTTGGIGGDGYSSTHAGGFGGGGGGGGSPSTGFAGGGGGGYSGGAGLGAVNAGGGGGGSYNAGLNQVNQVSASAGNGTVTITLL